MRIYGQPPADENVGTEVDQRLQVVTVCAEPDELRALAAFLELTASEMERLGDRYGHLHFEDRQGRTLVTPSITVYRADERPCDADGAILSVGDLVRVVGIPNLDGIAPRERAETDRIFLHLLGTRRTLREFDAFGNAVLSFTVRRSGDLKGWHSVSIETKLLRRCRRSAR